MWDPTEILSVLISPELFRITSLPRNFRNCHMPLAKSALYSDYRYYNKKMPLKETYNGNETQLH